ncbi:hypothetical protein BSIN_3675 [Burkholderia singularis]|uniref:Uncharacterized protein n=1 Tax=Burkholderia singularis TaxID=1503053 RepID=A0A238H5N8_9BURK|nr:hypothetical protein BSIN_3675 [Burkholderia singularis]
MLCHSGLNGPEAAVQAASHINDRACRRCAAWRSPSRGIHAIR